MPVGPNCYTWKACEKSLSNTIFLNQILGLPKNERLEMFINKLVERPLIILIFLLALSGCVTTNAVPLRKDLWQINATARGLLFQGQSTPAAIKEAAKLTISNGFTHFILGQPSSNQTSNTVGFTPIHVNVIGSNAFVSGGQPIRSVRETSSVLVLMLKANDPRALNALEAKNFIEKK